MSHKDKLYAWLKEHRPEVFEKIDADDVSDNRAREILNEVTGLNVRMLDRVEDGSKEFLEAFMQEASAREVTP